MPGKKRISLDLDKKTADKLGQVLPWGVRAEIIRCILDMVVDGAETHGSAFVGAVLAGEIRLTRVEGKADAKAG